LRIGVFDIGTNSLLFTVVNLVRGQYEIVRDEARTVRLGEGLNQSGIIGDKAMKRLISSIQECLAEEKGIEITAFSTEVMRKAMNRETVLSSVKKETGIDIKVLSGEEEALYNYYAIKNDFLFQEKEPFICDIGGGSTELIYIKNGEIQELHSFPIGAVVLKEAFLSKEIPEEKEIKETANFVRTFFNPLERNKKGLIGIGGTITTLAAMKLKMEKYDGNIVHGVFLFKDELEEWFLRLKKLNIEEKAQIPGLSKSRADILLSGILILLEMMDYFHINKVKVSQKGVRFGVLEERIRLLA